MVPLCVTCSFSEVCVERGWIVVDCGFRQKMYTAWAEHGRGHGRPWESEACDVSKSRKE